MSRDIVGRFAAATALFLSYLTVPTVRALSPVFVRLSRGRALQSAASRNPVPVYRYTSRTYNTYAYFRAPGSVAEDICTGRSFQITFGPVGRESRKVNGALALRDAPSDRRLAR